MRLVRQAVASNKASFVKTATRSIFTPPPIPAETDVAIGRRKAELEFARNYGGEDLFHSESYVPDADEGTHTNPIIVPSIYKSRIVCYENPHSHLLEYFVLHSGPLHYIPEVGLYFVLLQVKEPEGYVTQLAPEHH